MSKRWVENCLVQRGLPQKHSRMIAAQVWGSIFTTADSNTPDDVNDDDPVAEDIDTQNDDMQALHLDPSFTAYATRISIAKA